MAGRRRRVSNWLDSYLKYVKETEPPLQYHTWVGLSFLAGALERKCWVPWAGLDFRPNMYVVLVGPSGARKSTAMYFGADIFRKLGTPRGPDSTTREALVGAQLDAMREVKIGDAVYEHCSITVISSELQAMLGTKDTDFLSWLTDWYDCHMKDWDDPWTRETIKHKKQELTGMCLNLLGATTPDLIEDMMPQQVIGSGFAARVIWVWANKRRKVDAREEFTEEEKILRRQLIEDLRDIHELQGPFKLSPDAFDLFKAWYEAQDDAPPIIPGRVFTGYNERRAMYWLKLGMVLSAARGDSREITVADLSKADRILSRTEADMPKAFDQFGQTPLARVGREVFEDLRARGEITLSDISRRLMDFTQIRSVCNALGNRSDVRVDRSNENIRYIYNGGK